MEHVMQVTHSTTEQHDSEGNNKTLTRSLFTGVQTPALINKTIGQYFDSIVDNNPDHPAIIVTHQNVRLSY